MCILEIKEYIFDFNFIYERIMKYTIDGNGIFDGNSVIKIKELLYYVLCSLFI